MSNIREHEQWLKLAIEDAIEPDLPICDAHHHLWNGPEARGTYLLNEFLRDASGHNITKTVFMQCEAMYAKDGPEELKPVGETKFANDIAEQSTKRQDVNISVAAGIVGFADLTLGAAVVPVLEAHKLVGNRVKGIRVCTTWDPSPNILSLGKSKEMLLDRKFREGFSYLSRYGFSFDSWLYYTQLKELGDLAKTFPDTQIIINHVGGPLGTGPYSDRKDEIFSDWQRGISELAAFSNVSVKLGGLGMPRCGFGWDKRDKPPTSSELAEAMKPYVLFCINKFGVDRCMFESNFPVDKISYSYTVIWNAFKLISKGFSQHERAALFHDTAASIYRL